MFKQQLRPWIPSAVREVRHDANSHLTEKNILRFTLMKLIWSVFINDDRRKDSELQFSNDNMNIVDQVKGGAEK